MEKLKCWKRVEKLKDRNTFYNKNKSLNIFVFKEKNKWYSDLDNGKPFNVFKTKNQALKFANKYMKKHDKC